MPRRPYQPRAPFDIHPSYGPLNCEWPQCEKEAVKFRDTEWGDLPVCSEHLNAPIEGEDA